MKKIIVLASLFMMISCKQGNDTSNLSEVQEPSFYYGADLSYVNEMIDCDGIFKTSNGTVIDPYTLFSQEGSNLVRVRLWNNPTWTNYSNFQDVRKTIKRAKEEGMRVLLDFHYSDTWADPQKQIIPAEWLSEISNTENLGNLLYDYTYKVLDDLNKENLLPEFVQVGNEINIMILQKEEGVEPMNWDRNAFLINKGIKAVRDMASNLKVDIQVMLHIAQPENALSWFYEATKNNIVDYDWIGLSYYPKWSSYSFNDLPIAIDSLKTTYNKRVMVVETAYPYTLENIDEAGNILGSDALIEGYPATEQGQYNYLISLKNKIEEGGGEGLIYWEPAWISTSCSTLWGKGSHWDNATLFNHENKPTKGMSFYNEAFSNNK